MTDTTKRNGDGVTANRHTRRDLANLLMPNVDGSWEPVPDLTDARELLELHWLLLGATEREEEAATYARAADIIGWLTDEALRCRTDQARDAVAKTVRVTFEAIRTELPTTPYEPDVPWGVAEGWLTQLRLRNKVDRASEVNPDPDLSHMAEQDLAPLDSALAHVPGYGVLVAPPRRTPRRPGWPEAAPTQGREEGRTC
jgi:hypothetical protein